MHAGTYWIVVEGARQRDEGTFTISVSCTDVPTPAPTPAPSLFPTSSPPSEVPTPGPTTLPLSCASPAALYDSIVGQSAAASAKAKAVAVEADGGGSGSGAPQAASRGAPDGLRGRDEEAGHLSHR